MQRTAFCLPLVLSPMLLAASQAAPTPQSTNAAPSEEREGTPALLQWADFNADGRRDVYAFLPGAPGRLLTSHGEGAFEDVTEALGLSVPVASQTAAWEDFDQDGLLDLFVGYADGSARLWRQTTTGFVDWSEAAGLPHRLAATNVAWMDFDEDGRVDLHIENPREHTLFRQLRNQTFQRVTLDLPSPPDVVSGVTMPTSDKGERAAESTDAQVTPSGATTVDRTRVVGSVVDGPRRDGRRNLGGSERDGGRENLGGPPTTVGASIICTQRIRDAVTGSCIQASSTPTLGMLYPLGNEFFINSANGNVGIGTTTPTHRLTVENTTTEDALRLIGPGVFGSEARINFGDSDFVFIEEDLDDRMRIQAARVRIEGALGVGGIEPLFPVHVDGDMFADDGAVFFGTNLTSLRQGVTGNYGQANGWDPNPGSSTGDVGLFLESGISESGGFYVDGDMAAIWSPGDVDLLRVFDEDSLPNGDPDFVINPSGNVGVHRPTPAARVEVQSGFSTQSMYRGYDSTGTLDFEVTGTGRVITTAVQITGGGDLVEGFDASEPCEPGTVVIIDPENPGGLRMARNAYDNKVAGVVSGAGGVNHGIKLGQDGVLDGETLLAMTGRVYVKCSAENGAIRPGDRLTTAALAGHAMKATDGARSDGAVLGKAMSTLDEGTGLVLVLVNLQ